jgi:CO/xanthine dehydrogenase Mo-binding subunit
LRRRNFIRPGQVSAVGQTMRDPVDMDAILERALVLSGYREKRDRFAAGNTSGRVRKGIGFATFMHGAGFTGSGEVHLASIVTVEGTAQGRVRVLTSSTEIGQGTNTVFSQIAADALGLEIEDIEVVQPDTSIVPNSGPTVASRTCMVVGKLIEEACASLRQAIGTEGEDLRAAIRAHVQQRGSLRATAQYQPPEGVHWDDDKYEGDAYGSYAWAAYVAEVSVDMVTYEIRVDDFVAVQEVGRVIHPLLAAGQIEGGVAQAIGWALHEDIVWREGRMVNAQMTNYIMPTGADLPPIRVEFLEVPYERGPGGAKGIGELPMDGPAPAIANAVAHATGVDVRRIPFTPEALATIAEVAIV